MLTTHHVMDEEITQPISLSNSVGIFSFFVCLESVLSTVFAGIWAQRLRDSLINLLKLTCSFNKCLRLLVNKTFGQRPPGIGGRWADLSFPISLQDVVGWDETLKPNSANAQTLNNKQAQNHSQLKLLSLGKFHPLSSGTPTGTLHEKFSGRPMP